MECSSEWTENIRRVVIMTFEFRHPDIRCDCGNERWNYPHRLSNGWIAWECTNCKRIILVNDEGILEWL